MGGASSCLHNGYETEEAHGLLIHIPDSSTNIMENADHPSLLERSADTSFFQSAIDVESEADRLSKIGPDHCFR